MTEEHWYTAPLFVAMAAVVGTIVLTRLAGWGSAQWTERRDTREALELWETWVQPCFVPTPGHENETLPAQMREVRHQLFPNSGSSMADTVNNINKRLARIEPDVVWTVEAVQLVANASSVDLPRRPAKQRA